MDARNIPFAEEFDIIGAFDVLEHIEQDTDVLAKMYQATQNGGYHTDRSSTSLAMESS
jgi:2-polyprenyl-3-methyl-5-hydroxy-6-metoxy-1,4-benzoquinol methylase